LNIRIQTGKLRQLSRGQRQVAFTHIIRSVLLRPLFLATVFFVITPVSKGFAGCEYDLNGVGYGNNCPYRGGNTGGGGGGNSTYDYEAAQRAQAAAAAAAAAAAEAQRQRDAELEQQRIDADNKRRMEEIENQANFLNDRDAAAGTLRASTGSAPSGAIRETGLRGSSTTPELRESKSNNSQASNLDSMVVDARSVPTGLPNSIEAEIPPTAAGDRVRKGFEAITDHDWNAAQAWFRDALNHDPGNAGIQRLIDLAKYTRARAKHQHPSAATGEPVADTSAQDKAATAALDHQLDNQMDAGLAKALDDFNRNYLPKHPELLMPKNSSVSATHSEVTNTSDSSSSPDTPPAEQTANWNALFDSLFKTPHMPPRPGSVSGVRD
jgi:hypothetical protein